MEDKGIPLDVAQVPASQAIPGLPPTSAKVFPMYEELTFRANITSEQQGYELLVCIQGLVNTLGTETIIAAIKKLDANPNLINSAKQYLKYLI